MSEQSWHYIKSDNTKAGPISEDDLKKLLQSGSISKNTLVWHKGAAGWTPIVQNSQLLATDTTEEKKPGLRTESPVQANNKPKAQQNILTQRFATNDANRPSNTPTSVRGSSGAGKFIMIAILIAGAAAGAYFFLPPLNNERDSTVSKSEKLPDGENMGINEKMSKAEQYLSEFNNEALPAAQQFGQNRTNPKTARKHTKTVSKASDRYSKKLNALKLPCPTTKKAHQIPGYVAWAREYEERSKQINSGINAAFQGK